MENCHPVSYGNDLAAEHQSFDFPLIILHSLHRRSSHTRERERSPSQERWREYGGEDRWREDSRRDMEREPGERERSISSPEMGRLRGRERSVSVERENRSSSEERESGEI